MSNRNIEQFLNYLATHRRVSATTQNQALCAIIFMYRHVLQRPIEGLEYGFAKRSKNLPTVLSPTEVSEILSHMTGKHQLIAAMLYGCGFGVKEVLAMQELGRQVLSISFKRQGSYI